MIVTLPHRRRAALVCPGSDPARVTKALRSAADEVVVDLEDPRAVLDALAGADAEGRGAVSLDGMMLDEAVAVAARRTLTRAGENR